MHDPQFRGHVHRRRSHPYPSTHQPSPEHQPRRLARQDRSSKEERRLGLPARESLRRLAASTLTTRSSGRPLHHLGPDLSNRGRRARLPPVRATHSVPTFQPMLNSGLRNRLPTFSQTSSLWGMGGATRNPEPASHSFMLVPHHPIDATLVRSRRRVASRSRPDVVHPNVQTSSSPTSGGRRTAPTAARAECGRTPLRTRVRRVARKWEIGPIRPMGPIKVLTGCAWTWGSCPGQPSHGSACGHRGEQRPWRTRPGGPAHRQRTCRSSSCGRWGASRCA